MFKTTMLYGLLLMAVNNATAQPSTNFINLSDPFASPQAHLLLQCSCTGNSKTSRVKRFSILIYRQAFYDQRVYKELRPTGHLMQ